MSAILITGGAGFIGSQLAWKLLADGHQVTVLDDMSFGNEDNLILNGKQFPSFIKDDIRSKSLKKHLEGIEYVFHFGGVSSLPVCQERPGYAIDVNVAGTANVLESARLNNVKRIVFSSTSAVYENNTVFPSTENQVVSPNLVYSLSKYQAELLCKSYSENYGLEIVTTRYYNVYGPHQDFKRKSPPMTGYILRELLENRRPVLYSDGTQKRDYVYVSDVNKLNILCMTHPNAVGETFNVASGQSYTVQEIYQELASALGSNLEPVYHSPLSFWDAYTQLYQSKYPFSKKRLKKEVLKFTQGSAQKADQLLGWKPRMSLKDGMKLTAEYASREYSKSVI